MNRIAHCWDQIPVPSSFRRKGFLWLIVQRYCPLWSGSQSGKACQQEPAVCGHCVPKLGSTQQWGRYSPHFLLLIQHRTAVRGVVLLIFRVDFPCWIAPLLTHLPTCCHGDSKSCPVDNKGYLSAEDNSVAFLRLWQAMNSLPRNSHKYTKLSKILHVLLVPMPSIDFWNLS